MSELLTRHSLPHSVVLFTVCNYSGYITSDSDACADIYKSHHYVQDADHAVASCLAGGTDINSGGTYSHNLASSIAKNITKIADARAALHNAFKVRFRLGLFDPHVDNKNKQIPTSVIGSDAHHAASALTARQSMILLKNDGATLPLTPGGKIAVIGTSSNSILDLLGNYNNLANYGKLNDTNAPSFFTAVSQANAAAGHAR